MKYTCACGAAIDVASLSESLTIDLLSPEDAERARKFRTEILGFFEWTVDATDAACCPKCSAATKAAS